MTAKNHLVCADRELAGPASLSAAIRRWQTYIANWWADRRKYHQTIAELHSFTDRELADIGINRWQIRRTAQASIAKRDIES